MDKKKELVVVQFPYEEREMQAAVLYEDKKPVEIRMGRPEQDSILGNVYVGKVDKVVANIGAAFVNIGDGVACYYDMQEGVVKAGDEFVVQVTKEALNKKAPCVTRNISFTGKYLVFTMENTRLGLSGKLKEEDRARLKKWIEPLKKDTYGVVVRTNAATALKEDILWEYTFLEKRLEHLREVSSHRTCFSLLEKAAPFYISMMRDMNHEDLVRIVTDRREFYEELESYMKVYQPDDLPVLAFYEDKLLPLYKLFRVEKYLEDCLRERVWLPSGGFLVIQQTEAFVSIDVNSGKYIGKKKAQETYRMTNLEAAAAITAHLRLRNLSGIILIDFINLESEEHQQELFHVLQKHLRRDPVKAMAIDITKLGIVEVTRQRTRNSLWTEYRDLSKNS
ncbi:MAG: ribonuclease E/G [Lachnospiraceae bacterium]|nr:ribonuclease E/G [Lachnospiraceae bacterium]